MRYGIARLNSNGSLDPGFHPDPDEQVNSIVLQTDGKILVGGIFSTIGGMTRSCIARLNADGSVDTGFSPASNGWVSSLSLQTDGKVLVGGYFTTMGGVARNFLTRLINGPATQTLNVSSASRVEWLRGGTSPEASHVIFELSTDSGATYTALGVGTRISGGWECTGLSLPAAGRIRARARTPGGYSNGSDGLVEATTDFDGPEIAVSGNGVIIADGDGTPATADHTDFGSTPVSSGSIVRTFTIRNSGTTDLTLGAVTLGGADAADFALTLAPVSPVPSGGLMTLQVAFDPSAPGTRSATLNFINNDANENPFDFSIQGTGLMPLESWRMAHFGTSSNSGTAADTYDFDGDGLMNLIEYAFGLDPASGSSRQTPPAQISGGQFVVSFAEPPGVTGITYGAEWSADLTAGPWASVPDTGTGGTHIFSVPAAGANSRAFLRLRVTIP